MLPVILPDSALQSLRPADPGAKFQTWLREITPLWTWTWMYQLYIQQYLDKITSGELRRLMLFMPPRHGKSEMVTIRYPVYRLERDPATRIIVGAYNQTLADKFSRKSRKIARERFILSDERTAVEDWETENGGGLRAVGVGGGITGQGGDLIIIDDPVKSRKEANSKTYRDMVYDWYTDDLYTRLEPDGAMILIMTRWHEDDLAGRILSSEDGPNWMVITLPALADKDDPLGRLKGDALNPARYPVGELEKIRQAIGNRSFTALYQQTPTEQEGDIFRRSDFRYVEAEPEGGQYVRYWDKAASLDGDYTAGVLIARIENSYYIVDVVRGRWTTGERDRVMLATAATDKNKYGSVRIWWEQEPGSSGLDVSRSLTTLLAGYSVHADRVTGDKAFRAEPLASQVEMGNVHLVKGRWNNDFIDEVCSFPNGAHDDQVDAASGAFSRLSEGRARVDFL